MSRLSPRPAVGPPYHPLRHPSRFMGLRSAGRAQRAQIMSWWRGMTKAQVAATIKAELDARPVNTEFVYDLLADLLFEHHAGVKQYGIRPDAFRKVWPSPYGHSYFLQGRYAGEWFKNSYRHTIYPQTLRQSVIQMFRLAIDPQLEKHLKNHPLCNRCGAVAHQVDHINPQFKQIAENLYRIYSEDHWRYWLNKTPWPTNQLHVLPDDHPHVRYLRYIHAAGTGQPRWVRLQSLCAPCHKVVTAERRTVSVENEEELCAS